MILTLMLTFSLILSLGFALDDWLVRRDHRKRGKR